MSIYPKNTLSSRHDGTPGHDGRTYGLSSNGIPAWNGWTWRSGRPRRPPLGGTSWRTKRAWGTGNAAADDGTIVVGRRSSLLSRLVNQPFLILRTWFIIISNTWRSYLCSLPWVHSLPLCAHVSALEWVQHRMSLCKRGFCIEYPCIFYHSS